jgi:regulator of protease activity HflC (stomatin/prohibitin superfamily)
MGQTQIRKDDFMSMKIIGALAFVFLVLVLIFGMVGCTRIGPGYVGIVVSRAGSQRGVQEYTLKTGWAVYNPLATMIVEYPTFIQTAKWTRSPHEGDNPDSPKGTNEELSFNSGEGMNVNGDISLSYHLVDAKIPDFYVKFRNDDIVRFTHGYLRNVARDAFNDEGGHYKVEEIMGAKKEDFIKGATLRLQNKVADIGVVIDQMGFIESPRPPQQVIDSINAKVQATQLALQKQNEVMQAEADAKKAVAQAEGQAKATIAIANGEAEANRIRSASINENIIKWQQLMVTDRWISRWNGAQPQVQSGQPTGLLLNLTPHQ